MDSLNFKNGSTTGTVYLRHKGINNAEVSSTNFEWSLSANASLGMTKFADGTGIVGPWRAISSEVGGVTLEILPINRAGSRGG